MNKLKLSLAIVLFNEDIDILKNTIDCFLEIKDFTSKLYLIDNSTDDLFKEKFTHPRIEYYSSSKNIGFGRGHNSILEKIKNESDYHLILNPDVSFNPIILEKLINELEKDSDLSMIAPKVLFPDGKFQYSCRRYPKMTELFFRRFPISKKVSKSIIDKGVYADKNLEKPFYPEYLTGCFQLYKTIDFVTLNGFDERYFLYMEDVDICKKVDQSGKKKMYYPQVEITHVLKQGSANNFNLFFRHSISMIKYFMKWSFKI